MKTTKILIWDFDGTLATRDGMWTGTLVSVANRHLHGWQVTKDNIRPYLQSGFPWHTPEHPHPEQSADQWWATLEPVFVGAYEGIGIPAEDAHSLARLVRLAFLDASHWRVFDDVIPCLETLNASGWVHCVLSNHVPELPELARSLGLSSYFAEVITSAQTGYEKPHPEAFNGLLRRFPRGSQVWMVGDSFAADVQGAEAVGIPAVLVRKRQAGARYYCESLHELAVIVGAEQADRRKP